MSKEIFDIILGKSILRVWLTINEKEKRFMKETNAPLERLKHHVTGAIERGEKVAIVGKPAMKEIKHTPGPWHHNEPFETTHDGNARCFIGIGGNGSHIGYASITGCVNAEEAQANAQLIASAPELVKALEEIRSQSWWSEFDNVPPEVLVRRLASIRHITLDALAKAKGTDEDEPSHDDSVTHGDNCGCKSFDDCPAR